MGGVLYGLSKPGEAAALLLVLSVQLSSCPARPASEHPIRVLAGPASWSQGCFSERHRCPAQGPALGPWCGGGHQDVVADGRWGAHYTSSYFNWEGKPENHQR